MIGVCVSLCFLLAWHPNWLCAILLFTHTPLALRVWAGRCINISVLRAAHREQQAYAAACARSHPEFANPRLGFLGVIAFPNYYAASFGEFGSPSWARWGAAFVAARLPVRCCFLEALSFLRGIPGAP